jgi:hypothetical protein
MTYRTIHMLPITSPHMPDLFATESTERNITHAWGLAQRLGNNIRFLPIEHWQFVTLCYISAVDCTVAQQILLAIRLTTTAAIAVTLNPPVSLWHY